MKKRKTIAILVGTPDGFFRNKALNGIIKQAKSLDYNVAVFSVFTLSDDGSKHQQGENNLVPCLHCSLDIVVKRAFSWQR